MSHPLDAAFEKVRRANEHIDELTKEVRTFFESADSQPYAPRYQSEGERIEYRAMPENYLQQRGIALSELTKPPLMTNDGMVQVPFLVQELSFCLDVLRPFPASRLGAIVGEVAHNLRCALDYLVWELSVKKQGVRPPASFPPKDPNWKYWKRLQSPITEDSAAWADVINGKWHSLWAVDQGLLTRFERLQPYDGGKNARSQPLWILQELWNGDKHRSVAVVINWAGTKDASLRNFRLLREFFSSRTLSSHDFAPVEDGAEIARLELWWFPITVPENQNPAVNMDFGIAHGIAFGDDSPAPGEDVIRVLETLSREVRAILDQFSPLLSSP